MNRDPVYFNRRSILAAFVTVPWTQLPRGVRNNDPGNVRHTSSTTWNGEILPDPDASFATFKDMAHGVRASGVIFRSYQTLHGLYTIRGMITRWAPPVENNTAAYITGVAKACGVSPDDKYELSSKVTLTALLRSVFSHENGGTYLSDGALTDGTDLILG